MGWQSAPDCLSPDGFPELGLVTKPNCSAAALTVRSLSIAKWAIFDALS